MEWLHAPLISASGVPSFFHGRKFLPCLQFDEQAGQSERHRDSRQGEQEIEVRVVHFLRFAAACGGCYQVRATRPNSQAPTERMIAVMIDSSTPSFIPINTRTLEL